MNHMLEWHTTPPVHFNPDPHSPRGGWTAALPKSPALPLCLMLSLSSYSPAIPPAHQVMQSVRRNRTLPHWCDPHGMLAYIFLWRVQSNYNRLAESKHTASHSQACKHIELSLLMEWMNNGQHETDFVQFLLSPKDWSLFMCLENFERGFAEQR